MHLKGTVTSNSGTKVKGEIPAGSAIYTGTGTNGDCTSNLFGNLPVKVTVNSKLCIETVTGGGDTSVTTGCGSNVTFTLAFTGGISCAYSTEKVNGTFVTNSEGAPTTNKAQPAKIEAGQSGFCPSEGSINQTLDLYTTDGTALTIS